MNISRFALLTALLFLIGCANQNLETAETPVPTFENTAALAPAFTPTIPPTPTSEPSPTPTTAPPVVEEFNGMHSPGPWLVFHTDKGTYIVNQDGTEVGLIPTTDDSYHRTSEAAPSGGLIATYQHPWWADVIGEIEIRRISDNAVLFAQDLDAYEGPPQTFADEFLTEEYKMDLPFAVGKKKWSHDGQLLAFTASIHNPSSDLYVYDLNTEVLSQVTSTVPHAVDIYWSPDDAYLFHADVDRLHNARSGSGYEGWKFYTSSPDGSDSRLVFESDLGNERGWENFLGWYSDDEAILKSSYWWCGDFDFRIVNVKTGQKTEIYSGIVDQLLYDPTTLKTLAWVSSTESVIEECDPKVESGLYFLSIPDGRFNKVTDFEMREWVTILEHQKNKGYFLLESNSDWLLVDVNGNVKSSNSQPYLSPFGGWVVLVNWDSSQLSINNLETDDFFLIGEIKYGEEPVWGLNTDSLFYFKENDAIGSLSLYMASAPDFNSVLVVEDVGEQIFNDPIWVNP